MESNDRVSKPNGKRKRKPSKELKYEIVQAEGELDVEGLAYLLAQMIFNYHQRQAADLNLKGAISNPHSESE